MLRTGRIPLACGAGITVAAVLFPVSRIGNIAWLAVTVDTVLLICLAAIPFVLRANTVNAADTRGLDTSPTA